MATILSADSRGLDPRVHSVRHRSMVPVVYIMASKPYGTLYVGVTSNLFLRGWQHREGVIAGFTKTYGVHRLVYYEQHLTMASAMQRERNIKHWARRWKIKLIESINPMWDDLYPTLLG